MELMLFGYRFLFEKVNLKNKQAENIRNAFETGSIDKIQAIKLIRHLFLDTTDSRSFLKGAKDYVERNQKLV